MGHKHIAVTLLIFTFVSIALILQIHSHAVTPFVTAEPETGGISAPAHTISDAASSAGKAVTFAATATPASRLLLGHWDESPLRLNEVGGKLSNYNANKGVDKAMAAVLGKPAPISHIMKAYDSTWRISYASSAVAQSAEFGHAFIITMPSPGGGGNAGYAAMLNGSQDGAIDAFFNSIPTSETAYIILQNEADNTGSLGTDPVLYTKALGYLINRAAPIYQARGLRGAVGPVFMCYSYEYAGANVDTYFQKWNYIQYVNASAKPYAFYGVDCYSKYTSADASTYESIPNTVNQVFSRARAQGITRFGLGEFANSLEQRGKNGLIVGTPASQEKWINTEVPKIKAIQGLEFAVYFHKPTGPESKNAQLLDANGAFPFTAYAKQF
jgi:hypothetical protein